MRKSLLGAIAVFTALAVSASAVAQSGGWQIGPHIRGRNYSVGMPYQPTPNGSGWSFNFPGPGGHVDYVTFNPGSLAGARQITVRYRVDAAPGAAFVAQDTPQYPPTVSVAFQRAGDDWSARGEYEFFRWYAPHPTVQILTPGEHEMTVSLNDPDWISVNGRAMSQFPGAYRSALGEATSVGLVFGSSPRRGHGVYATAPARFTLLSFDIR